MEESHANIPAKTCAVPAWTDTQKHLVDTTIKTTGWGVAAGFIFAGWLMADATLDWHTNRTTCYLVVGATAAISVLWVYVVKGASQACRDAFPAKAKAGNVQDDPTRLIRQAPLLATAVACIIVAVTVLACLDNGPSAPK